MLNNLGGPGPPRRKLVYPGGGDGGRELPRYDSGPTGEPESRGRRAPGGAWGQLSEEARDELTRPLRVGSGRAGSPGEGQSQWQPDHRDLRQGEPRLPEPGEEPAEGGGEPGTIERPRVRARLVDQGERTRPPGDGSGWDPMPPSLPGVTPAGPSTLSEAAVPVGGEAEARPRPKKRHQKRLQRPSGDARLANKRANPGGPEPQEGGRWNPGTEC